MRDRKRADVNGAWLAAVRAKGDFVGVQNYTRRLWGEAGLVRPPSSATMVDLEMEYYPQSLGNAVEYVFREVGKPVFVTENGVATNDDAVRARYIPEALAGLIRVMGAGAKLAYCDIETRHADGARSVPASCRICQRSLTCKTLRSGPQSSAAR